MTLTHTAYLPFVASVAQEPYKGLAMAVASDIDLHAIGASWYYSWGPSQSFSTDIEFVPMLWGGSPSDEIPHDYAGNLLFLNEPNIKSQSNITPQAAVDKLAIVRQRYPLARVIGCGTSIWAAASWVSAFLRAGGVVDAWHIHAYVEAWITPQHVIDYARQYHDMTGGAYWVTEYGVLDGDVGKMREITEAFMDMPWVERIAAYTNRQVSDQSWTIDKRVEMVRGDGSLTPVGEYYRNLPIMDI